MLVTSWTIVKIVTYWRRTALIDYG